VPALYLTHVEVYSNVTLVYIHSESLEIDKSLQSRVSGHPTKSLAFIFSSYSYGIFADHWLIGFRLIYKYDFKV